MEKSIIEIKNIHEVNCNMPYQDLPTNEEMEMMLSAYHQQEEEIQQWYSNQSEQPTHF